MLFSQSYSKLIRPLSSLRFLGLFSTESLKKNIKTLFVGNLPFNINKDELSRAVEQRIGNSFSVRLAVDNQSGAQKGFGFLDFDENTELEAELSKLEGLEINGRNLLLQISVPRKFEVDTSLPVSESNGIFIGNLPFDYSESEFSTLVTNSLGASSIEQIVFPRVTNKGFCHVYLADESLVGEAIDKLSGLTMGGRQLNVDRCRHASAEPYKRRTWRKDSQRYEIFLSNFSFDFTKEMLISLLDEVVGPGTFRSVRLKTDDMGNSKGYGFVEFFNEDTMLDAVDKLHNMLIHDRRLKVEVAKQKTAENPIVRAKREVFIGNLPPDMTELMMREMLDDMMGQHSYTGIRFMKDENDISKGFAYVEFENTEVAAQAVESLRDLEVMGHRLRAEPNDTDRFTRNYSNQIVSVNENKELFLFNIGFNSTLESLTEFLQDRLNYPDLKVRMVVNRDTGHSKGYGYATFKCEEDAMRGLELLQGVRFMGRELKSDLSVESSVTKKNRSQRGGRFGSGGLGGAHMHDRTPDYVEE